MIEFERHDDGTRWAVARVVVGVAHRRVEVPLGRVVDEVDPGGLRNTPVVVTSSRASVRGVRIGAERAAAATVAIVEPGPLPLGARILAATSAGEVVLVVLTPREVADAMIVVRALGGRPLPVLPFDEPERVASMLDGCWVDLDVAVPSIDGPAREEARRVAEGLGLFDLHHVIEVDPRAGLDSPVELPTTVEALAAAATGVLAGRIAAGNRRWR